MKISVLVSVADMLVLIYRYQQKYRLGENIGIGIGYTHIGPTLDSIIIQPHPINIWSNPMTIQPNLIIIWPNPIIILPNPIII